MADQLDFETALERRLQARASMAARPFDASAIAGAAVVARPARRLALSWTFHGLAWGWVAVMLATLAIVGGTLMAGALLRDPYQGPWLAYTTTGGLYLAHEDGTQPRRIFASEEQLRLPGWSADGTLLAVATWSDSSDERTLVVDRDGRVVWSREGDFQAVWSHRGHRLATMSMSPGNTLVVTDIDTGAASTWLTAPSPDTSAGNIAWSPDDTRIALTWFQGDGPAKLRLVALDGSVRDVFETSSWMSPRWSPDGRQISVVIRDDTICGQATDGSCPGDIVILDVATGTQVDGVPDLNSVLGVDWSPDGTRLAWDAADMAAQRQSVFVGTLPLSGGEAVQVTDLPGAMSLIGWSGDGRSVFAERWVEPENSSGPWIAELWRVPMDPAAGEPVLLRSGVFGVALQPTP